MTDTQPPTLTLLFPTQEDGPEEPGHLASGPLLRPDTIFLQTSNLALKPPTTFYLYLCSPTK